MGMLANKHLDPVIGIDVHLVIIPPSPTPVSIPHPHAGVILDPKEYLNAAKAIVGAMVKDFASDKVSELAEANPEIANAIASKVAGAVGAIGGAVDKVKSNPLVSTALAVNEKKNELMNALGANVGTGGGSGRPVIINGMMRATVGTHTKHLPGLHFPLGASFGGADINPSRNAESYMGSKTVSANNDPLSFMALPALSCWMSGMVPADHNSAHTKRTYTSLPTATMLPIPLGRPVYVGGPPILNLLALLKFLWKAFRGSKLAKALADKLGLESGFLKCVVLDAEPVNSITGEVVVEQEDFVLPGRLPFVWQRYYNGHHLSRHSLGYGWNSQADIHLDILHYDSVIGVVARFPDFETAFDFFPVEEGDKGKVTDWQRGDTLVRYGNQLRMQTKSGLIYDFTLPDDWQQRMSSLPDVNNIIAEGHYQPTVKNTVTLKLKQYSDLNGNCWRYRYDQQGKITSFTESQNERETGRIILCHYNKQHTDLISHLVLTVANQPNHLLMAYDYDAHGNLVSVTNPANQPYTFGYEAGHRLIRHTNRNGLSFYYQWQQHSDNIMRVVHAWGDDGLYNYHFSYDIDYSETRITDSLGYTTRLQFNDRQLPVSRINALGQVFSYRYDECSRTIAEVDPQGHVKSWNYDDNSNLVTETQPDRTKVTKTYNSHGKPICITDPMGGKWQQAFDEKGNLIQQTTPLGVTNTFQYDISGQLITFTDPQGNKTQLSYDYYGYIETVTDPLNQSTHFQHDYYGNLLNKIAPNGDTTYYHYDICHRLIKLERPDGRILDCVYDPEGNLTRYTDDQRLTTRFEYFGQGLLVRRVEPDGSSVRYHYDTEEQLTGVENQHGEVWHLKRDPFGRLIEEIDYWGKSRTYQYNAAGHLTQSGDPLGQMLSVICDKMGRIVSKSHDEKNLEQFKYNKFGQLTEAINHSSNIFKKYNADGQLIEEKQQQQDIIACLTYQHQNGSIIQQTQSLYRDGGRELLHYKQEQYFYDAANRITALQVDNHPAIQLSYDENSRLKQLQFNESLSQQFNYNRSGLMTINQTYLNNKVVDTTDYYYDENNNLVRRYDSRIGTDQYRYDPLGQIIAHSDPLGKVKQFTYDKAGNRFRVVQEDKQSRTLVHDNQLIWKQDNAGQLLQRNDNGNVQSFDWDCYGRLQALKTQQGYWRYSYDPLGRRISKQQFSNGNKQPDKITWFIWNGDSLAAEIEHQPIYGEPTVNDDRYWHQALSGLKDIPDIQLPEPLPEFYAQSYSYLPGTFEPLLLQTYKANEQAISLLSENMPINSAKLPAANHEKSRLQSDNIYYYQNDSNGMPLKLRANNGDVVWEAHYATFGFIDCYHQQQITQPLRLQGQYFDKESQLHYNRFRYYDAKCGMFISQDPIGLVGGGNPYQFAPNVLGWVDPLGLSCSFDSKSNRWRDNETGRYTSRPTDPSELVSGGRANQADIDAWASQGGIPNSWGNDPVKFPSGGFKYDAGSYSMHGHGANPAAVSKFPTSNAAQGPTVTIKNTSTGEVFRTDGTWGIFKSNPNGAHIPLDGSPY